MPQVPESPIRNIPYETATTPVLPTEFGTASIRGLASFAAPGSQLGQLLVQAQDQQSRTKTRDSYGDLVTFMNDQDAWFADPKNQSTIEIKDMAKLYEDQANKKLAEIINTRMQGVSSYHKGEFNNDARLLISNRTKMTTGRQIALVQDRAAVSIFKYTQMILNDPKQSPEQKKKDIMTVVEGAIKAGDLPNDVGTQNTLGQLLGQVDVMEAERQKAALAVADRGDTIALSKRVIAGEISLDDAIAIQNKDPRYDGRNEDLNAQNARLKEIIAGVEDDNKSAAKEIEATIAKHLGNKQPGKILDMLEDPAIQDALNKVDPDLLDKWQGRAYGLADKLAKGKPVVVNEPLRAKLNTMATDVWRGTVTSEQANDAIADAYAKGEIDDQSFRSLTDAVNTTLKSSQAEFLSRADTEVGRMLVDYRNEFDYEKMRKALVEDNPALVESLNKKRRLQFEYLRRFNAEMRQIISDDPKLNSKTAYQEQVRLATEYYNALRGKEEEASFDVTNVGPITGKEISKAYSQIKIPAAVKQGANLAGIPLPEQDLPEPKTIEEARKLPSGTRFKDTNGVIRIRP